MSALRERELEVIDVEYENGPALAVQCKECGGIGPRPTSNVPAHAVFAWNQRQGRLTVVK